jgi:hypothetical protein
LFIFCKKNGAAASDTSFLVVSYFLTVVNRRCSAEQPTPPRNFVCPSPDYYGIVDDAKLWRAADAIFLFFSILHYFLLFFIILHYFSLFFIIFYYSGTIKTKNPSK